MTDETWPTVPDDPNHLEHSRSLQWLNDEVPEVSGPYVPGGNDLPPQGDTESEPQPPVPAEDE